MKKLSEYQSIKNWAFADRPREKLLKKGQKNLTDAELIAILIGSGSKKQSAVELSRHILQSADNHLHTLGTYSVAQLMKFKGIGEAKAISIIAALELGRRRQHSITDEKEKIRNSRDVYQIIKPHFIDLPHEEFWVYLLNRANQITRSFNISKGGVTATVVDVKFIFKYALEHLSPSIIIAHNHPSGNIKPSDKDIQLTQKIVKAGKVLDIQVLDHIIVTNSAYYSFQDEGLI